MEYRIFSGDAQIPDHIARRFRSPHVARNFFNSRLALLECLNLHNISLGMDQLDIENHHYLKQKPEMLVSISHTNNVGAAAAARNNEFASIGIDIEFESREVNPGTAKFFQTGKDSKHNSLLELWIKKEAAFKALSPLTHKDPLVLKDIWVQDNKFGLMIDDKTYGEITTESREVLGQKLLIALALVNLY